MRTSIWVILLLISRCTVFTQNGWFAQSPIPQVNPLNGVSFTDPNTGTAVGEYGTIIRTTDGGAHPAGRTWIR